jgi:hypothetical protein
MISPTLLRRIALGTCLLILPGASARAAGMSDRPDGAPPAQSDAATPAGWWWPTLPAPAAYFRTVPISAFADRRERHPVFMMVQSASGLAAAAVRRAEYDAMVWVDNQHPNQRLAFEYLNKRLALQDRGTLDPWALVQRLKDDAVVRGYILYDADNASANVATSLAGPMRAVIVDASLEARAKEMGLTLLADVRTRDTRWLLDTHKDLFTRKTIAFQNLRNAHLRDYTIAHDILVVYGDGPVEREALARTEPLSPVLGWNRGDEGANAKMFSQYALFNTATDWALNLPLLSAGAANADPPRYTDPARLPDTDRPGVAFVMSDGDNLQWMTQNFFADNPPRYWQNPARHDFPYTWTLCIANLRQAAPDLLRYSVESLPANATVAEFGGGYYFPDAFGELRDDKGLLAEQARRTWANMQATNVDVLCLIFDELKSDKARAAMQTYADTMPGLRGILAMDYSPYSKGEGEVIWIERKNGAPPLPVVTCRYELRTDVKLPTTGGVDDIVHMLTDHPLPHQWIVQHAWSSFESPTPPSRRVTGLDGSAWAIERLRERFQIITAQEMFQRLVPPNVDASALPERTR